MCNCALTEYTRNYLISMNRYKLKTSKTEKRCKGKRLTVNKNIGIQNMLNIKGSYKEFRVTRICTKFIIL